MSGICAIPGCNAGVFRDSNGTPGKYCRRTHKFQGEGCISCRKADKLRNSSFCHSCDAPMKSRAPVLVPIPQDHETYNDIANQFQKSWRSSAACPKVQAVYRVVVSQKILDTYNAYRKKVEAQGRFASQGLTWGNQRRRWHGTTRGCNVGDNGQTTLCSSKQCALCCIMKSSFDMNFAAGGCYGRGIYTSSNGSKSNGYISNRSSSPWKAILLSYVVVGRAKKYTSTQSGLTAPPAGYDSVIADVVNDELIVYTNDAVCPAYLVMFA